MTSDLTGCILPDPSSSQDGRSHRCASLCLPLVSVRDVRNQEGWEESACFVCSTSLQEKQSVHSWDLETRRHAVSPVLTQNSRCLCLGPHFSLERSWTKLNNVRLSPSALHLVTNLGRNPRTECTCMGYLLTVSSLYFCEKTGAKAFCFLFCHDIICLFFCPSDFHEVTLCLLFTLQPTVVLKDLFCLGSPWIDVHWCKPTPQLLGNEGLQRAALFLATCFGENFLLNQDRDNGFADSNINQPGS